MSPRIPLPASSFFHWFPLMIATLVCQGLLPATIVAQQSGIIRQEKIFQDAPFPSCHASTLAETSAGLVAAWFGGTREKDPDVEIYLSREIDGRWTEPISVANGIQHSEKRYPCWNPVLFQIPNGPLLLFYKVGPDPEHWWGELKESLDQGKTWSQGRRLPEDILGPVKNKPILVAGQRLLCPSSKETTVQGQSRWQVYLEETRDFGRTWSISDPLGDGIAIPAIQPSVLQYPDGRLQLLCRSKSNRLATAWSTDAGKTWTEMELTELPNPNSGTDAVTLADGRQLLVYNPTQRTPEGWGGPRTPLSVAISDDGLRWRQVAQLESEPGEYSYPAVIQTADGQVHITYTWKRKSIVHCVLDADKL